MIQGIIFVINHSWIPLFEFSFEYHYDVMFYMTTSVQF